MRQLACLSISSGKVKTSEKWEGVPHSGPVVGCSLKVVREGVIRGTGPCDHLGKGFSR